jgi:hypothetical protein
MSMIVEAQATYDAISAATLPHIMEDARAQGWHPTLQEVNLGICLGPGWVVVIGMPDSPWFARHEGKRQEHIYHVEEYARLLFGERRLPRTESPIRAELDRTLASALDRASWRAMRPWEHRAESGMTEEEQLAAIAAGDLRGTVGQQFGDAPLRVNTIAVPCTPPTLV